MAAKNVIAFVVSYIGLKVLKVTVEVSNCDSMAKIRVPFAARLTRFLFLCSPSNAWRSNGAAP